MNSTEADIKSALDNGRGIKGNDGLDVVLRGDGWYFEHFRLSTSRDAEIITKSGPYMACGVPNLIYRAYRAKFG